MIIIDRLEFYFCLHATLILLFGSLIIAFEADYHLGILGCMRRRMTGETKITRGAYTELMIVLAVILLAELCVWIIPKLDVSLLQNDPDMWVHAALAISYSFGVFLSPGALSNLVGSNSMYREGLLVFCIVCMLIIAWGSAFRFLSSWPVVLFPILGSAIVVIGYTSSHIGDTIVTALTKTTRGKRV